MVSYTRIDQINRYSLYWRQLLVKNHGIPEDVIEGAVGAGKEFFYLPKETKLQVCPTIVWVSGCQC